MRVKATFDAAIIRSEHLLRLYELLQDTRQRSIRKEWSSKFKALMHWPAEEKIVRVDGRERKSILILRQELGIDRKHFSHEYLSELLRATVVTAVSALDRYVHDLVTHHCWSLLSKAEDRIPSELAKLRLPVLATKRALEKLRANKTSKPGLLIRAAVQEVLHRDHTFQKPDAIKQAMRMLGITDFWSKVASQLAGSPTPEVVKNRLREIVDRRNQVVHEADVIRKTKAKRTTLRDISEKHARDAVKWIKEFATAVEKVVATAF